jgi:hypothetical protein
LPALTRRRYPERTDCWHVYYADVHVGTIVRRVGCPHDEDPWEWSCGFYPGSRPGEHQAGTAETFDEARAGFETAWHVFLAGRTEADFRAWRYLARRHGVEICQVVAGHVSAENIIALIHIFRCCLLPNLQLGSLRDIPLTNF